MACIVVAYIVMACTVVAYIVMACTVVAYIVMACIVVAYVVMAHSGSGFGPPRFRFVGPPVGEVRDVLWL